MLTEQGPIRIAGDMDLTRLTDGAVLLWQFAEPGHVDETTRLCIVQGSLPLIASDGAALSPAGSRWIDAISLLFDIQP
jgi:hypothetical protein